MKIPLGDINVKVGRKINFKPTIGNKSLHKESNDTEVRIVKFGKIKNLVVKNKMFPQRNIRKGNWTSPDGQTHNQIDDIFIDRR